MAVNINQNQDKTEGLGSRTNFLRSGFSENSLIPSNELLYKKEDKEKIQEYLDLSMKKISSKKFKSENESQKNNSGTSSKKNKKTNKGDIDSYSVNKSLLIFEEKPIEDKKPIKIETKERRYIVDNIDNIFSKLNEPKFKLIMQEFLLYLIVIMVCIYYWIFLFISKNKVERNYCFGRLYQFDSCSVNQICDDYKNKLNLILFNDTFEMRNKSLTPHDLFIEENKIINVYYKPFFLRYSHYLSSHKLFSKIQMHLNSNDKTNFVIVLTAKEKWNLFYRNFSLCEFNNYYIIFVIMIAFGGIVGSFFFGIISDIYGRRSVIRITLFVIWINTCLFAVFSFLFDYFYEKLLNEFIKNHKIDKSEPSYINIFSHLYAQEKIRGQFKAVFNFFCMDVFILSAGLWPLLKSCMALLIENSTGELKVLIGFRRYNFAFGGIPPFFTSLFFVNMNNFTATFISLSCINFILFICSIFSLEESVRYYYEYCDWPKLTEVVLNTYKVNLKDFRTLNDEELREFKKDENLKNFNNTARKMNLFSKSDNNSTYIYRNTYYNDLKEKNIALNRNIKRDTDFIIKLKDVKSNPFIIITCLTSNRTFIDSKFLILIILILLYVLLDLLEKELLEVPYFTINDLYIDFYNNFLLNSVFFYILLMNISSNFFFYGLYRINCFKTIIIGSLIYLAIAFLVYHILTSKGEDTPIDLNQYNFSMLNSFHKDNTSKKFILILLTVYFALNGVLFYVYLLILRISKTIYRCTYFSIHSISLIIAFVITECAHCQIDHYFLFLSVLDLLCLLTFAFLSEFKELLYIVNDLKIDIFRQSKNIQIKDKID